MYQYKIYYNLSIPKDFQKHNSIDCNLYCRPPAAKPSPCLGYHLNANSSSPLLLTGSVTKNKEGRENVDSAGFLYQSENCGKTEPDNSSGSQVFTICTSFDNGPIRSCDNGSQCIVQSLTAIRIFLIGEKFLYSFVYLTMRPITCEGAQKCIIAAKYKMFSVSTVWQLRPHGTQFPSPDWRVLGP